MLRPSRRGRILLAPGLAGPRWRRGYRPSRRVIRRSRDSARPRSPVLRRYPRGVTTNWNAATYDRIADPQARWGAAVLDRLPLVGDERVMDVGCGSGRVTAALAERLPRGSVVAVDASPSMIAEARRRLESYGDRIEYVTADVSQPLDVTRHVDAVLSTAAFHWVLDHDA